jgi:hypothetical protein
MITDGLISLPIAVLTYLVGLLPDYSGLPSGMETAITTIGSYIAQTGDILPLDTIGTVIGLIIAIELVIMTFNTLAWLFHWKQAK